MQLSTVGNLMSGLAREHGNRTALVFPELNSTCTFAELDEASTRVAKNLNRAGFRKGDRFAVWAKNLPEWVILQFATAKIAFAASCRPSVYQPNMLEFSKDWET